MAIRTFDDTRSVDCVAERPLAGELAAAAVNEVAVDPERARILAEQARAQALVEGDHAAASTAEQALGMAARKGHNLVAALAHLRLAVRIADEAGLATRAAQARVVLAGTLALQGHCHAAVREADRAATVLRGHDLAVLHFQRGFILQTAGRLEEALESYQLALPAFRRAGDVAREARTLGNRGIIHGHLGALGAAEAELARAERLYVELGQERVAADVRINLGWLSTRQGNLPAALSWFDRADDYFRERGLVDPMALLDRCEALLTARLVAEARRAAESAIERLSEGGSIGFQADAQLRLSEAALLQGDADTAVVAADAALRAFTVQRRPGFAALARYASLQAAQAGGATPKKLVAAARRTADALALAGWAVASLDARLVAVRLAIEAGRLDVARAEMAYAVPARGRGPVALRSRAWHAEALMRLAMGDRRGADCALRAGMRVLENHRAALGATELRARASAHAADLAGLGLRLALEDRRADRVLTWAERWRAGSLQLRPVLPPAEPALRDALGELRQITAEVGEAAKSGRDTRRLLARQASLEEKVRRRAHQAPGPGWFRPDTVPTARMLLDALSDRALIELVEHDGSLHAVVLAGRSPRLRRLCGLAEVVAAMQSMRFALRRLAYRQGSAASQDASRLTLLHSALHLDDLLFGPIRRDIGDRPLVVVPAGSLHELPWAVLPFCAHRPVSVSPSAALWYRATVDGMASRQRKVVLISGPGLLHVDEEVAQLRGVYPQARCLVGDAATVGAAGRALDGAALAHVAAHGRFRADNPLFSSLRLADGPLTVYDLETLRSAPGCLVLSACDAGLSEVCAGDELMGLAAALLGLGTRSVIASVMPVPDTGAPPLMVALHKEMRAGTEPAEALARAQASQGTAGGADVAAASFVCLGA